jgi:leucyl-tRNA synthetase
VDSSWYFLRYLDPRNDEVPFDPDKVSAWMPMNQYSGGITHAVMHLIYARFFQKVLMDMGMLKDPEPFPRLLNQGMITMGGRAMSKSRGNLVEPVAAFDRYGPDALRLYMLFSGPPEQDFDWPPEGVEAIGRVTAPWLQRVWRLAEDVRAIDHGDDADGVLEAELRRALHRTIKVVTHDYEAFSFNTAIARMQELVNEALRYRSAGGSNKSVLVELVEALMKMLAPMAPYLTEEQWHLYGHEDSIHLSSWPAFEEDLTVQNEITMIVQVNGKVRETIDVPVSITEDEMRERALSSEKIKGYLAGKEPTKVIIKPPKLVSLVVK